MKPEDLALVASKLPLSRSTLARNPGLAAVPQQAAVVLPGKRLRQDSKPLMNKLEQKWAAVLAAKLKGNKIHAQAIRFKLANGIWFKVDFCSFELETCWEVKGPHAFRGGFENLKCAADRYPEFQWLLVWQEDGSWREQRVLP